MKPHRARNQKKKISPRKSRKKTPKASAARRAARLKAARPSRAPKPTSPKKDWRRLLHEREAIFDAMINAFPDTAMIVDVDGKLLACNKAALQKLADNPQRSRRTIFEVFPHLSARQWHELFNQYRDEKKPVRFEKSIEGQYYFHNFYPVIGSRGEICFIVVFVQDITGYRHAENALQENEQKYRELVENISDAIYALSEEGAIIYINPAIESFLGFTPDEVTGRPFEDFLHPAEVALVKSDMEGFLAGRTPEKEYRFIHKDGSERWGRVSSHPVVYKRAVIGYQGVIADITQTKSFNINLLKVVQENILANLAAAFAAEIGVPLKRARERLLSHSAREGRESPVDESLRSLMHDLEGISLYLKHFHAFTGQEGQTAHALDVNSLAESALILLKQQFASLGIETQCELARGLEPVSIDSFSLVQSLVNILNYSLQAYAERGAAAKQIALRTRMEKDKVVLEVRDHSGALTDELLAHLADPFYAHSGRRGVGIGLAIARQLVDAQGGEFDFITGKNADGLHVKIAFPSLIPTI